MIASISLSRRKWYEHLSISIYWLIYPNVHLVGKSTGCEVLGSYHQQERFRFKYSNDPLLIKLAGIQNKIHPFASEHQTICGINFRYGVMNSDGDSLLLIREYHKYNTLNINKNI